MAWRCYIVLFHVFLNHLTSFLKNIYFAIVSNMVDLLEDVFYDFICLIDAFLSIIGKTSLPAITIRQMRIMPMDTNRLYLDGLHKNSGHWRTPSKCRQLRVRL